MCPNYILKIPIIVYVTKPKSNKIVLLGLTGALELFCPYFLNLFFAHGLQHLDIHFMGVCVTCVNFPSTLDPRGSASTKQIKMTIKV